MAVTVRGSGWGGPIYDASALLRSYIEDRIRVLEPDLRYAQLGKRRDAPKGFDRILFPQANQLPVKINLPIPSVGSNTSTIGGGSVWGSSGSIQGGAAATAPGFPVSSTEGVAAITEGTNPTAITWGATAYSTGLTQYGILVQVTDLLVRGSAIEVVSAASEEVRNALARAVDTSLQGVVNAGANGVVYSGNKTSRTALGAGDTIAQSDMQKAWKILMSANAAGAKPFEGSYYVAIIHPQVMSDLMSNTSTGSWLDAGRYVDVAGLKEGKMGDFRGMRYLLTAYQNYFASTTSVFPTTVLSEDAFGWGYFQQPTPILVTTPDSNNPLNTYTSIGGKVAVGATRFEDSIGTVRIARVESAITN